jgi:ethanolamine-phosphate cytidylyltransferase
MELPPEQKLNATMALVATFCIGALTMYWFVCWDRRKKKANSMKIIKVQPALPAHTKKPTRIYLDGCWDVMHSGHYNALRQAKALGDVLVVGVHSDEEITRNKREPVMNNEQRMAAVSACKWADEVVFDVPYAPSLELLNKLKCDYVAHGDDIPLAADGQSAYHCVQEKLKIFRRTPGVSTTHLIQRLVDAVKSDDDRSEQEVYDISQCDADKTKHIESTTSWSSFLASSSRISAFSNNRVPNKHDTVIYIDGVFDLFHVGHIAALKAAKQLGTFLYVGLYDDDIVRAHKGRYYPLMNLQERVLNVLSCKYVDDVLIGAPWKITKSVLKSLNVKYVVMTKNTMFARDQLDRYQTVKELGLFKEIQTESDYTTEKLMQSIAEQQVKLEEQNKNRVQRESQYINNHAYIQETA